MSVVISPPGQLGFPRPLTTLVKRALMVHNPHASPVAFKVKTTAPKQYCVRPNQGRIEPGETVEVSVLLQPLATEPPPHAKCKDKFLVQSAFIAPDEEMRTLPEMWAQVEKTDKSAIHEQKVRCVYLAPEDGSANANGIPEESEEVNGNGHPDISRLDESPANHGFARWTTAPDRVIDPTLFANGGFSSWELPKTRLVVKPAPLPRVEPPAIPVQQPQPNPAVVEIKVVEPERKANDGANPIIILPIQAVFAAAESSPIVAENTPAIRETPATPVIAKPIDTSATNDLKPVASAPIPTLTTDDIAAAGGVSATNAALESSLAATTSDKDKLAIALKEIDRLRSQLAEAQGPAVTGLRKRGNATGSVAEVAGEKVAQVKAATSASGVPVEVCAALVVSVFVLTYLFF